jgi:hypothetical protein
MVVLALCSKETLMKMEHQLQSIKVLNLQRRGASKSFIDECGALRNIRQRNLVKIITSCSSIDFQGNNFKAKGSLKWLHPTQETHEMISRSMKFSIQTFLRGSTLPNPLRITGTPRSIASGLRRPLPNTPARKENLVYGRIPTWRRIDKGRSSLETFMGEYYQISL